MLPSVIRRPLIALPAVPLVLGVALAIAGPASAASQAVSIGDGFFGPAELTVSVGDTVTWTNTDDSPHTVTAADGAFDSGNLESGATFSFTFTEPGTYTYVCQYHDEMMATITVTAATGSTADAGTGDQAGGAAVTPAAAPAGAPTAGTHDGGHQPDTALPAPVSVRGLLPAVLIGLGLLAFAFALVPPRSAFAPASGRREGGWRR